VLWLSQVGQPVTHAPWKQGDVTGALRKEIAMNCQGCMAVTGPMGRMTEECQRLIAAGLCQKQVALSLAKKGEDAVIDGECEEVRRG